LIGRNPTQHDRDSTDAGDSRQVATTNPQQCSLEGAELPLKLREHVSGDRFLFTNAQLEILRRVNVATDKEAFREFCTAAEATDAIFSLEQNPFLPYLSDPRAETNHLKDVRSGTSERLSYLVEQGASNYHREMSALRLQDVNEDESHRSVALYAMPGATKFGGALDREADPVFIVFNQTRKMAANITSILKRTSTEPPSTPIVSKCDEIIALYVEVLPRFLTLLARESSWLPNEINSALESRHNEIETISFNHTWKPGSIYYDLEQASFEDIRLTADHYLDAAIKVWNSLREHLVSKVSYDN
jgi:hypothetical protein